MTPPGGRGSWTRHGSQIQAPTPHPLQSSRTPSSPDLVHPIVGGRCPLEVDVDSRVRQSRGECKQQHNKHRTAPGRQEDARSWGDGRARCAPFRPPLCPLCDFAVAIASGCQVLRWSLGRWWPAASSRASHPSIPRRPGFVPPFTSALPPARFSSSCPFSLALCSHQLLLCIFYSVSLAVSAAYKAFELGIAGRPVAGSTLCHPTPIIPAVSIDQPERRHNHRLQTTVVNGLLAFVLAKPMAEVPEGSARTIVVDSHCYSTHRIE